MNQRHGLSPLPVQRRTQQQEQLSIRYKEMIKGPTLPGKGEQVRWPGSSAPRTPPPPVNLGSPPLYFIIIVIIIIIIIVVVAVAAAGAVVVVYSVFV